MDQRFLHEQLLACYREIVPEPSVDGTFLIQRLAAALYARGGRIVIGGTVPYIERTIHQSLDPDQRIVWTCKDWNRTLGYRSGAMVGHHFSELLTPDSVAFLQEVGWPAFLKEGKIGPVPFTLVAYDGRAIPCMLKSEILRGPDGSFERTFAKLRCQLMRVA
jgi:hypothetical protein